MQTSNMEALPKPCSVYGGMLGISWFPLLVRARYAAGTPLPNAAPNAEVAAPAFGLCSQVSLLGWGAVDRLSFC